MLARLALIDNWWALAPYLAATFFAAYLIGSIPFGIFFARLAGAGDLRKIGSGNIGATNVLRTGKKWAAVLTLLFDGFKGAIPVLAADYYFGEIFALLTALGAFLGHIFSIWLGFRGGKGVATFIGVTLALHWYVGLMTCLSWLIVVRAFRMSSLAALVAAAMTPLYFVLWNPDQERILYGLFALLLAILIFFTHRKNIVRIVQGREPKLGKS